MEPVILNGLLAGQSDARLVELARRGSERAFEALVRRHRRALLAHCRRVAGADRAEDALQCGLLAAWLALRRGTEVREARAWLFRIAHNSSLRVLRGDGPERAPLSESVAAGATPEAVHGRRERLRELLTAIDALPETQREALVQTALEGRSYDDVAGRLGISQGSLRGLLQRARGSLRGSLTAVTPMPLLLRLTRSGSTVPPATAATAAHAGAGTGALLLKGGAVVIAAGGIGVGTWHLSQGGPHSNREAATAHVRPAPPAPWRPIVTPSPPVRSTKHGGHRHRLAVHRHAATSRPPAIPAPGSASPPTVPQRVASAPPAATPPPKDPRSQTAPATAPPHSDGTAADQGGGSPGDHGTSTPDPSSVDQTHSSDTSSVDGTQQPGSDSTDTSVVVTSSDSTSSGDG